MARLTEIKKGENFSVDGREYKIADGLCPYIHFDDGRKTFRVYENTENQPGT